MDGAIDRLTLMVLAEQQPRAKLRNVYGPIECASCVLYHRAYTVGLGQWRVDNQPGAQGTCRTCDLPMRRARLNPV